MKLQTLAVMTALALWCSDFSHAQQRAAHYKQSEQLRERLSDKVNLGLVHPRWVGPDTLWYQTLAADGTREYLAVDAAKGSKSKLFETKLLAQSLSSILGKSIDPSNIPLEDISPSGSEILLLMGQEGRVYTLASDGKTISEYPDSTDTPFHLKPLRTMRPSQTAGGTSTAIYFINLTQKTLDLQWIDGQGKATSHGQLNPGERKRQHTFSGHVWAACAQDGSQVEIYMGAERPAIAAIKISELSETSAEENTENPPLSRRVRRDQAATSQEHTHTQAQGGPTLFIRDYNVWMKAVSTQEPNAHPSGELQLTTDGTESDSYGGSIHISPESVNRAQRPGTTVRTHVRIHIPPC